MISILVLTFLAVGSLGHPKCCEEENFISGDTCLDGSDLNINATFCMIKMILNAEEYTVTESYSLMIIDTPTPEIFTSDQYCITKEYDTHAEIAIVCLALDSQTSSFNWRATCAFISVFFIFVTVLVYFLVPQLRDLQGKCIVHSLLSLGTAFFTLALVQLNGNFTYATCIFMAFLIYTSFLLAFFWLNVVALNTWRKIIKPDMWMRSDNHWYLAYCLYAYGMTAIFVLASVIAHHSEGDHIKPGFGEGSCFFNGEISTWTYFYGPTTILLLANLILFGWAIKVLWSEDENCPRLRTSKYRCLLTLKLFFIMGLFWIFEVISFALQGVHKTLDVLWVFTDILNSIQGVLIFLVLVVFRRKALKGLANNSCLGSRMPRSWKTLEDEESLETDDAANYSNV